MTTISVSPIKGNSPSISAKAAIDPEVTCDLPLQGASHVKEMAHIKPLELADPTFHIPGILLGGGTFPKIMLQEQLTGPENTPMAVRTVFGWAIIGEYLPRSSLQSINALNSNPEDDILTRFWRVEEPPSNESIFTPDEEKVQHHYADTHVYVPDPGYYQVSLPRVEDHPELGLSRPQACHRFLSNERALIKRGTHSDFQKVVREYLELGHAEKVPQSALTSNHEHYYLPMHGVTKASSKSTKLRVVFDASAKITNHLSLNDILATGPTLHPTLETILLQFCLHSIALSADISKMYRAVHLNPNDRDLHRFLWREEPNAPLVDYRMTRVTFGVSSSPFLAIKTLRQLALDFGTQFPSAAPLVLNSFYVDDLLTGAETPEQALNLFQSMRELLSKGGFDLRKWRSSSQVVLASIDPSLQETLPI